ncbi:hypothetical protein ACIGO7_35540 [Streptomyces virginiae]|uniref:hypothetical protein n=1 Tax=Streptomyces virginiae TaxID=1961 RepID=UPI00344DCC3F
MTASTAEQQARLATLAAAIRTTRRQPAAPPSAWTPEQQQRHRTTLTHALDGTEWHQPIPPRRQRPAA